METIKNTIYFESDAEFEDFCIAPYATIEQDGVPTFKGALSDEYKQCLAEGKTFVIMDEDSAVYKHQIASKNVPLMMNGRPIGDNRMVHLKVENLEQWFDMPVPRKFRDTFSQLVSSNPDISYTQLAKDLGVSEDMAFIFMRNWKKR